jgi:uridine kinase
MIVIEGIMALVNKDLRALGDLKVFINASRERRLVRRIERDMKERGRSYESIIEQYFTTVQPMFEEIIAPSQYYADLIINNDGASNKSIDVLVSVLQDLLEK